jgi:hypothetical protein
MTMRTNRQTRGTFKVSARERIAHVPVKVGTVWHGKAYRSDTGYEHPPGLSAMDVLNFEADELGNDTRDQALRTGIDFSKILAKNIVWVTRSKAVARDYGEPEQVNVEGYTVVAEDRDGGYLLVNTRGR